MSARYFHRVRLLFIIFILLFTALAGRLFKLQMLEGDKLAALADKIRTQIVSGEEFPRGDILDRHGVTLLDTAEQPAVAVFPAMLQETGQVIARLGDVLGLSEEKIRDRIELAVNYYAKAPFILKTNLTPLEKKQIEQLAIPGVYTVPVQSRYGPNSLAVHLIGHLNSIDEATWEKLKAEGKTGPGKNSYKKSDVIGVKGIEAIYESYLRGNEPGHYLAATVDAKGRLLAGLGFERIDNAAAEKERANVVLTLDKQIQNIVEEIMDKRIAKGAAVVMRVPTGEVLAMASRPTFDQNAVFKYLGKSERRYEFINRALEHFYPGSVFKVLIAAAALEEGIVQPDEKFNCTGEFLFDSGLAIPCWKEEGHGLLTFSEALAQSCNPTFIEVGLRLGREKIIEYARRFGLLDEVLIGYNLNDFPSVAIAKSSPAAIGNASIGQQGIMLSPLQVAGMIATVANGGIYKQPRVVERVENGVGEVLRMWQTPAGTRVISRPTAAKLQAMLAAATTSGTAKNAWIEGWGTAGKTSTAQTGSQSVDGKEIINAWFAGFAPLEHPEYAVVVMVEDGTAGGTDAAPVFKEIVTKILVRDMNMSKKAQTESESK